MTLDEPVSEDLIREVISIIFKNTEEKLKLEIEKGSNVGEGYLGITSRVRVEIGDEEKHLFVKMMPQNKKLRKVLSLEKVFEREVDFYSEIYPIFNEISLKYSGRSFDVIPRCFLTKKDYLKEAIVSENIAINGYSTKKDFYNKQDMMMILKTYSRFHACGFIFKNEYPKKFEELIQTKKDLFFDVLEIYDLKNLPLFGINILNNSCSLSEDEAILNKMDKLKTMISKFDTYTKNIDEYSTIIHIDCWKNNLMFKYEKDSNQPEDLKLVDMQMWTINSPVFDLLHFMYSNMNGNETQELLDFYIDFYYESLSKEILKLGRNPNVLYPKHVYISHFKKYSLYGFFMASMVLRSVLGDNKDLPNVVELIMNEKPLSKAWIFNLRNEEAYTKRLKIILNYLIKNDVI